MASRPFLAPALAALVIAAAVWYGRRPASRVDFEDAHVVHDGGRLSPELYTMMRTAYRCGWVLGEGDQLSFLARQGRWTVHFHTGLGATIQLGDQGYVVGPDRGPQSIEVPVPRSGRISLRCLSGAIDLDRMERHE